MAHFTSSRSGKLTQASRFTAREILHREYGDAPNFMTPDVLEVGKMHPCVAFEVSKGSGFEGEPIYGVSVVRVRCDGTTKRLTRLSELFFSRRQADWHVYTLRTRYARCGVVS